MDPTHLVRQGSKLQVCVLSEDGERYEWSPLVVTHLQQRGSTAWTTFADITARYEEEGVADFDERLYADEFEFEVSGGWRFADSGFSTLLHAVGDMRKDLERLKARGRAGAAHGCAAWGCFLAGVVLGCLVAAAGGPPA